MGKSAKLYRLERDALQEKLNEALQQIAIFKFKIAVLTAPTEEIRVTRIDISGYQDCNFIEYLIQSDQFGGARLTGETEYLDVIGIRSPETEHTLRWLDSWNKQPTILRRLNDHNRV